MGKKGSWLCKVRKALTAQYKEKKYKKSKSKKNLFVENNDLDVLSTSKSVIVADPPQPVTPPPLPVEVTKQIKVDVDDEQRENDSCVVISTTATSEEAVATANATTEVISPSKTVPFRGKSKEEISAIKIQTAFRRYFNQHDKIATLATTTASKGDVATSQADTKVVHMTTMSPFAGKSKEEIAAIKIQAAFRGYLNKHNYVALATNAPSETTVATTQTVTEVIHPTNMSSFMSKLKEENATIKIQTAFRGFLVRKEPQNLKGLTRVKSLIKEQSIKNQEPTTLRCMENLSPMQPKSRAQRIKISKEDQTPQRQLQKYERKLDKLKIGEVWDDSPKSKQQVEANLHHKQEAAMRREKALAYASTRQQKWKNSKKSKSSNSILMTPNNSHWSRSLSEQWRASRPQEEKSIAGKNNNNNGSMKRFHSFSFKDEINWAHTLQDLSLDNKPSLITQKPRRQSSFTLSRRPSLTGFWKAKS